MNASLHRQLIRRKRRIARRIENRPGVERHQPMMAASNIHYQIAERVRAIAPGGIGAMHLLAQRLGLVHDIDQDLHLLKRHLPYFESDHVLNIAYNLLAGGQPPGAPRSPAQRRGLPRRPRGRAHPRPHHGGRLLPPVHRGRCRAADGHLQRRPDCGPGRSSRTTSSRKPSSMPTARSPPPTAGASRAWTSRTTGYGATTRWWSRWPTPPSRCSWSTGAATGPRTSTPPSTSTGRLTCAAGAGSAR